MLQDALGDKHIAQQSRQQGVHSPFPDPHYHTSRSMGVCTLPDGSCACLRMYRLLSAIHQHLTCGSEVQKHKLTNHASRQTHTAIAHGKPMHRGRQVLNRIRRMQQPGHIRSCGDWMEDQARKHRLVDTEAGKGWRVHIAKDASGRNATTTPKNCNFMCSGGCRREAATCLLTTAGRVPLGIELNVHVGKSMLVA